MTPFGNVPASSVLPVFFDTFAAATGAPITMTNFAVGDVLIYKGTSMTQRSSTAGVVLLDTDGVDLDGITGIQGFSIDLGDNTDAGFYATGSFFNVVVSTVTVDGQTLSFVAATFRIVAAEGTAGTPVADATRWNNLATVELPLVPTTAGRKLDVSAGGEAGVDWANVGSPTTAVGLSGTTVKAVTDAVALPASATIAITGNITGNLSGSVGSVTGAVGSVTGAVGSVAGLTASDVGAIKTTTDKFVFTVANQVDCNVITKTGFALSATGSAAMTEGYPAKGGTGTLPQLLYNILQLLEEKSIASTTQTILKRDQATTMGTYTLDSATTPSSITRAT